MNFKPNRKNNQAVAFMLSFLVCTLLLAPGIRAIEFQSIDTVYVGYGVTLGSSWVFGRWNATAFFCENGTTGYADTGVFATLWNDNVETGHSVLLLPENFTVSAALAVPTGVKVDGSGRSSIGSSPSGGTVLTLEYDGNVFVASGDPSQSVTVSDLTINGQRHQRTAGNAIYGKFRYGTFKNLFIMDMDNSGIVIEGTSGAGSLWDNTVENCEIWWCDDYGAEFNTNSSDCVINGGHIAQCDMGGLYINRTGGHRLCGGLTMDDNYEHVVCEAGSFYSDGVNYDQSARHGIYLYGVSGGSCDGVGISGGRIKRSGTEADNTYSGIYCNGYSTSDSENVRNVRITSVIFEIGGAGTGQSKYCAEFAHSGTNAERDFTIVGNDFRWGYQTDVFNVEPASSTIFVNDGYLGSFGGGTVGSMGGYGYIIYKNSTSYQARDYLGAIVYTSTNASYVERSVDSALTALGGGLIFVKTATYTISTAGWYLGRQNRLLGEAMGAVKLDVTANIVAAITISPLNTQASWAVENFEIDMNSYNGDAILMAHAGESGGLCESKLATLYIHDVKVGYCGVNAIDLFNTHFSDLRIRTYGYGLKIGVNDTYGIDYGNCQFDNIRIGLLGDNTYGLYIQDGTKRACNLAVFNNLEVLGGSHIATGIYVDDNKITFNGGTVESCETYLIWLHNAGYVNIYNMHIGHTGSTNIGVYLDGTSHANIVSGGWIYTSASGTCWHDDSTTSVDKNIICDGTYLGVGLKDFGTNTMLGSNVWILKPGTATIAKSTNTVIAYGVVSGGTLTHGLYTYPRIVILTTDNSGIFASYSSNSTTTVTVTLRWWNGTLVDANHSPCKVMMWCSVSGD